MSILEGIDVVALQARLTAMQTAYLDLTTGNKVVVASYAQGDGSRTVTYTQANIADLAQAILMVQTQIDRATGVRRNRRAPILPFWRGR